MWIRLPRLCGYSSSSQDFCAIENSVRHLMMNIDTMLPPLVDRQAVDDIFQSDLVPIVSPSQRKSASFWLCMAALNISLFLAALDITSTSTATPTIIQYFQGTEFIWVGSAYTLAAVAFLPLSGQFANTLGRRPTILFSLLLFAFGSALCGGAQSMNMLIGGRTVQGVGAGGIFSLSEIILSDLVPLSERGLYKGMLGMTWAVASTLGPIIGGAFSQNKRFTWRGLFYLNIPLTGIAMLLCLFCMNLKTPLASFGTKMRRVDWIGNIFIMASSTSALIGLTWGGVQYPWSSARVLAPLVLGLIGIVGFMFYEAFVPIEPTIPIRLLKNRTTLSGYIGTGLHGIIIGAAFYYLPVYFQACQDASPLQSGVDMLPYTLTIAPLSVISGVTIKMYCHYKLQNIVAWVTMVVGLGLQSRLRAETSAVQWIIFQIVPGIGFGMLFAAIIFPILAPLSVADNSSALTFLIFVRTFFETIGITIGSSVLQNQLSTRLPPEFISSLPEGVQNAYAIIPEITGLTQPLKSQVQTAFADAIAVLWEVMIGVAALGFLSVLFMQELPLQSVTDEKWGLKDSVEIGLKENLSPIDVSDVSP